MNKIIIITIFMLVSLQAQTNWNFNGVQVQTFDQWNTIMHEDIRRTDKKTKVIKVVSAVVFTAWGLRLTVNGVRISQGHRVYVRKRK